MAKQFNQCCKAAIPASMRRRNSGAGLRRVGTVAMLAAALLCGLASVARAQDASSYTRETFEQWFRQNQSAKPDLKPGDVLTARDLERMRPFVPPGYLEQLNFPEFRMEIATLAKHTPSAAYMTCTEKYGGQVNLAADGALVNYKCGQPFPQLDVSDPQAGMKAEWNFDYHWDNYGLQNLDVLWIWDRFGGNHEKTAPTSIEGPPPRLFEGITYTSKLPTDVSHDFGGGGTFDRILQASYQRVRFSHLAQLDGAPLPFTGAGEYEWKEMTYFYEPFDIRGTAFIIFRREDPHLAESAWAYIPNLRRVRRVSSAVKSDSLLGTDIVLDDFYGFNGRPLDWNWKFWGFKDIIGVTDSKYDYVRLYGPNGQIPDDRWSLRKCVVLERTPRLPRYPYSSALMFVDAEAYNALYHFAFDVKGKLWKTNQWQWKYSEDAKEYAEVNHGTNTMFFQNVSTTDVQNKRATLIPCYGCGYPNLTPGQVQTLFDINKLEEVHR